MPCVENRHLGDKGGRKETGWETVSADSSLDRGVRWEEAGGEL